MTAYEMSISDWSSDVCSSDLIADALIVVGIEDQHRTIVIDRGLLLAQAPQRDRKPCSRPHIGPGLEKPPEVTGQLLELVAERAFACLHTLTVQRQRVLLGARRSEEHTSELQSLMRISYAVFCLKKKKKKLTDNINNKHELPKHTNET